MKKILIVLTIAISCLGIRSVSADTIEYVYDTSTYHSNYSNQGFAYNSLDTFLNDFSKVPSTVLDTLEELAINYYNQNYSSTYPYYAISMLIWTNDLDYFNIYSILRVYSSIPTYSNFDDVTYSVRFATKTNDIGTYNNPDAVYENSVGYGVPSTDLFSYLSHENLYNYNPLEYYSSNFNLLFDKADTYVVKQNGTDILSYSNNDVIIPYKTSYVLNTYTEINLNDYAYVALALKDYNKKAFETTIQVKGQYCLTPVYNYGMTERKDILEGTQVDRCSPYYDNYTPIRTYILENDLKNNAIYYLKSYDSSRDNYVKVDTSIFDVTYVTEENKDNPYVTIGGKTYPTIPYDNLTDTATKSEDEGYVSGAVEEFSFADIFTAPMEFLEDIWDSIVSVFDLIKEFFSLLPEPIPTFLLSSFLLGLAIGLLKLIF